MKGHLQMSHGAFPLFSGGPETASKRVSMDDPVVFEVLDTCE